MQVEAVSPHRGVQEDEMSLATGQTANVLKKTTDGQQEAGGGGWTNKLFRA
jgi:hypothetical protein